MDLSVIVDNFRYLMVGLWPEGSLSGAAITVFLSLTSGLLSAIVGIVLGIVLACAPRWANAILVPVLGFFRSIPIVMLIFGAYFVLPKLLHIKNGDMPQWIAISLSLGVVGGAYLAYSVAAGINSLPKGQWRAGTALGLSWLQIMRHVILPQALPRMLPSFINQWVSLIKDTSLGYIIGTQELTFLARQVSSTSMQPATVYLFVALIYFICCSLLDLAAVGLRKTLSGKTV